MQMLVLPTAQQVRPWSQKLALLGSHAQLEPVHGAPHSDCATHVPGPPGAALVPQQTSPRSQGFDAPVAQAQPALVQAEVGQSPGTWQVP